MKKILLNILMPILLSFHASAQNNEALIIGITGKPKPVSCMEPQAFGVDLGILGMTDKNQFEGSMTTISFGIRGLRNYNSYIGLDYIKWGNLFSVGDADNGVNYFSFNPQLMTGIRGYSPTFYKCMSGYGALRIGYGLLLIDYSGNGYNKGYFGGGVCYEFEIGLNITRKFFVGFTLNLQGGSVTPDDDNSVKYDVKEKYAGLRFGFNL